MAHEHYLYESISEQLRQHIRTGSYSAGERLPSVRQLSQLFSVSVYTVVQCFRQLEADGYIEIRPRSGVFVHATPPGQPPSSNILSFPLLPVEVSLSEDILHFMEPHVEEDLVRLGIALPACDIMPIDRVMRTLREVTRNHARQAWDQEGLVIYCSSFSKTLMPGMRLGWVAPGRFHKRLRELKQISSITTTSAPQLVMARLLESGFYARHLERLRQELAQQSNAMSQAVAASFPPGTHITQPAGGCALWIGLPQHIDSRLLFTQAINERIHIFPGNVFSAGPRHFNYLRLNTGQPVDSNVKQAVYRLGELAGQLSTH